jgi:hypothetical protein
MVASSTGARLRGQPPRRQSGFAAGRDYPESGRSGPDFSRFACPGGHTRILPSGPASMYRVKRRHAAGRSTAIERVPSCPWRLAVAQVFRSRQQLPRVRRKGRPFGDEPLAVRPLDEKIVTCVVLHGSAWPPSPSQVSHRKTQSSPEACQGRGRSRKRDYAWEVHLADFKVVGQFWSIDRDCLVRRCQSSNGASARRNEEERSAHGLAN